MWQCRSRGSTAPTAARVRVSLPCRRGFTGNPLSGGDLFGNASSFKTINRDNFINFAAEISPDLGRVILIRSAGSRRGTSGAAWIRCGMAEKETDRGKKWKGKERERRREKETMVRRRSEDSPAVGPFSFYHGRNSEPHATNLPLPGYIHAHGRCFLTWVTAAMDRPRRATVSRFGGTGEGKRTAGPVIHDANLGDRLGHRD